MSIENTLFTCRAPARNDPGLLAYVCTDVEFGLAHLRSLSQSGQHQSSQTLPTNLVGMLLQQAANVNDVLVPPNTWASIAPWLRTEHARMWCGGVVRSNTH